LVATGKSRTNWSSCTPAVALPVASSDNTSHHNPDSTFARMDHVFRMMMASGISTSPRNCEAFFPEVPGELQLTCIRAALH
jgi:hypothetical protein